MALNSNHTFEDLGEVKCSVIEKNCSEERTGFLKRLLEYNGFTVVKIKSPLPKTVSKPVAESTELPGRETEALPETFTVGVTDLSFNVMNAIYNRELKTLNGKIVTPGYWKQLDKFPNEDSWYWKN